MAEKASFRFAHFRVETYQYEKKWEKAVVTLDIQMQRPSESIQFKLFRVGDVDFIAFLLFITFTTFFHQAYRISTLLPIWKLNCVFLKHFFAATMAQLASTKVLHPKFLSQAS